MALLYQIQSNSLTAIFIFYILIFENELDIEGPNPAIDSTGEGQVGEMVMSSHLDSPFIWLS